MVDKAKAHPTYKSAANIAVNLHHFEPCSVANGPGKRAVIWFQGCSFQNKCVGCFNAGTHNDQAGSLVPLRTLAEMLLQAVQEHGIEGVTISGGEPLHQAGALTALLYMLRNTAGLKYLSVIVLTGYDGRILENISDVTTALQHNADVIIAGRYDHTQRLANHYIGSANKEIIFLTNRYSEPHFESVPNCEIMVNSQGEISVTGIDPVALKMLNKYL